MKPGSKPWPYRVYKNSCKMWTREKEKNTSYTYIRMAKKWSKI